MRYLILLFLLPLLILGCDEEASVQPQDDASNQTFDSIYVTYKVTYQGQWTASSHPLDYPDNTHFSGAIGMTHKAGISLFQRGQLASRGIKVMAEVGQKSPLTEEINSIIEQGNADQLISQPMLSTGTSKVEFEIQINPENSYVSIVSMIAPSPDWFIAIEGLQLYENNEWIEDITVEPVHYDAGTDSGDTFNAPNMETTPQENIFEIVSNPLGNGHQVENPVATFRFQKL